MLEATVITPPAEDFPDPYDKTTEAAKKLFSRVCDYMDVDRSEIEFEIFPDETEELKAILPSWSGRGGKHAAGLYIHAMKSKVQMETTGVGKRLSPFEALSLKIR